MSTPAEFTSAPKHVIVALTANSGIPAVGGTPVTLWSRLSPENQGALASIDMVGAELSSASGLRRFSSVASASRQIAANTPEPLPLRGLASLVLASVFATADAASPVTDAVLVIYHL